MQIHQIHVEAKKGNIAGVASELAQGVKIDRRDKQSSKTPLMIAVCSPQADIEMLRYLVEQGANVNAMVEEESQRTVLSLAVQSGSVEKVQFLLEAGADIHYQSEYGYDVLIDAMHGRDVGNDPHLLPLLELLLSKGAPVDGTSRYGESAIRVASSMGRFDAVRLLLDAGADADQLQWTELMAAIAFEPIETVKELIAISPDQDVDFYARDSWGRSPWLLSLQVGDVAKAQFLLAAGAYGDDRGPQGKTPLMYAIENNRASVLEWLIQTGYDIEAADEFEMTPLMLAAECGATDCVRILLKHGADPVRVQSYNNSAIKLAANVDIVRLLVDAGADLSDIDDDMRPALTGVACEELQVTREQYLTSRYRRFGKANPQVMNNDFWQAMVCCNFSAYGARATFGDTDQYEHPVWCYHRFGRTMTELPDGRLIEIAGEHEDFYDPDFCIYNDIVVYQDGNFQILGYPQDVFPPTDFHSSTLVGDYIYIVGNLGYRNQRIPSETPVYRLHTETFVMARLETTGSKPGWISRHKAYYQPLSHQLCIAGGKICVIADGKQDYVDNLVNYTLDLKTLIWHRADT